MYASIPPYVHGLYVDTQGKPQATVSIALHAVHRFKGTVHHLACCLLTPGPVQVQDHRTGPGLDQSCEPVHEALTLRSWCFEVQWRETSCSRNRMQLLLSLLEKLTRTLTLSLVPHPFTVTLTCVMAGECVIPSGCAASCWCCWWGLCSAPRWAWPCSGGLTCRGGVDAAVMPPSDSGPWWGMLGLGALPLEDRACSCGCIWACGGSGAMWAARPGLEAWDGYDMYMPGCWGGGAREWGWVSELAEGCWPG